MKEVSSVVRDGKASWLLFRAEIDPNLFPPHTLSPEDQIREAMAKEVISERHLLKLIGEMRLEFSIECQELLSELLAYKGSGYKVLQASINASLPLLDDGLLNWWTLECRFKDGQLRTEKNFHNLESIQRYVKLYDLIIEALGAGCLVRVDKNLRSFLDTLVNVYKKGDETKLRIAYEKKGIERWPFPAITVMRAVVHLREYSLFPMPCYPGENQQYVRSGLLCAIPALWWVATKGLEISPLETIERGLDLHAMSVFQRMYQNTLQKELPGWSLLELLDKGKESPLAVYNQLVEWFDKPWLNQDGSRK